jgi:hypothetical protein
MSTEEISQFLEASYLPQAQASAKLAAKGFTYDPESSNMERKVFVDTKGNPHIAYRGSVRADDWLGNARIALGKTDKKMEGDLTETGDILKKYAGKEVSHYGHSRGGRTAELAGERFGGKVYTFNKATAPTDIFKMTRKEQTDIRTTHDLVSLPSIFQTGGKKVTLTTDKKTPVAAHAVSTLKAGTETSAPSFVGKFHELTSKVRTASTSFKDKLASAFKG